MDTPGMMAALYLSRYLSKQIVALAKGVVHQRRLATRRRPVVVPSSLSGGKAVSFLIAEGALETAP